MFLLICVLAWLALPVGAQVTLDWKHGSGGVHREGGLVPFHARLENTGGEDLVVVLEGSWEGFSATIERRVELAAGARKELDLYLGPARLKSFDVRLKTEDGELLEEVLFTSVWARRESTVVGIVDPHPMGWGTLLSTRKPASGAGQAGARPRRQFGGKVAHLDPRLLPNRAEALRTFDLLIWPEPKPRDLTGEQVRAVAHWVETGGHLVLATSTSGDHALTPWTGIDVGQAVAARELRSLAEVGGPLGPFAQPMAAVALRPGKADVWLTEPWGPLAVEEQRGAGVVTVLGFDPSQPPVARWPGLGRFWLRLLERHGLSAAGQGRVSGQQRSYYQYFNPLDLASTARSLLARQAAGPALPLQALGVVFVLYMLIIGPGEYLLLRRLDRLKWTWFTFPLWVVLFSAVAYGVVAGSKSDVSLVRHVQMRHLLPGAEHFSEELHAALFVTHGGDYRLVSRSPETLPIPGGDPPAIYRPGEQPLFVTKRYEQGASAISDRVNKWGFLSGTFLGTAAKRGSGVDAELRWHDDRLVGWLLPRLGTDLAATWLLTAVRGEPRVVWLGAVRDSETLAVGNRQAQPVEATNLGENWLSNPTELPDLARMLLVQTCRGLLLERRRGLGRSTDRVIDTLVADPHPHHDWSRLLEDGGAVFLGWAADEEPRIASFDLEAESEGIVIYRVGLRPSAPSPPSTAPPVPPGMP